MRKTIILLVVALLCFGHFATADPGDTVVVQTLTFDDITKRRGWYLFPDESTRWEKVLMYYTLKCDNATTQDQYPCGEWDYTTFTHVYQHENLDQPYYTYAGNTFDSMLLATDPSYTRYQEYQYFRVIDAVNSEDEYPIGTGSENLDHTFFCQNPNGRAQYLWKANEMTTAGLSAGEISKLKLDITTLGDDIESLKIRIKHTDLEELSSAEYEKDEFVTVYAKNTVFPSTGLSEVIFTTPFVWDGISNIVVDLSYSNPATGTNYSIKGNTTTYNSGIYAAQNDGYYSFFKPDYIDVPKQALETVGEKITVSFWLYGDPTIQPSNTYVFNARDTENNRVLNAHVPWSNSNVYWDAGNSGSSYDRIFEPVEFEDIAGQWNHYTFTKNTETYEMKIYLNGTLLKDGSLKVKTMEDIDYFRIAGNVKNGKYDGYINDFTIWDVDLDEATINEWMFKDINDTHPNYDNLKVYYKFDDESSTSVVDNSGNEYHGIMTGIPEWKSVKGEDQFKNLMATNQRPNIVFIQGNYTSHVDSTLVMDSVMNSPKTIFASQPEIDFNNPNVTFVPTDTMLMWDAGYSYTYLDGVAVDSVYYPVDTTLKNHWKSNTFQIQNYVTPYGINLDLGPNGFTWIYDVTDYLPILRDTVDISAGNQQELIDLKFVFIEGTPPRDVLSMNQIWRGDYGHAAIADDEVLPAVDVALNPDAEMYAIRTRTTGHWFGGFNNCAEFCPKHHHLKINGNMEFEWLNWTECADNPVYPQGGTWVYDRAGWCPGSFADTYNWDITDLVSPGDIISVDYGMEAYPTGGGEGNYRLTVQLFEYSAPNFNTDAAITDIVSPNNWEYFNRYNPICGNPIIEIKNTGINELTSLTIQYGLEGNLDYSYNWTGGLEFLESERVELPAVDWNYLSNGEGRFQVTISNPNSTDDEYEHNNTMVTNYSSVPVYLGQAIILKFQTNNAAHENDLEVVDPEGNVVFSRTTFTNSTLYVDTIELDPGCYNIRLLDSDDDGIDWWANNNGSGWFKIFDENDNLLLTLEPDFGKQIEHRFAINDNYSIDEMENDLKVAIYPNPSDGFFNVSIMQEHTADVDVLVFNSVGHQVYQEKHHEIKHKVLDLDLSNLTKGIYFIKINSSSLNYSRKIVIE